MLRPDLSVSPKEPSWSHAENVEREILAAMSDIHDLSTIEQDIADVESRLMRVWEDDKRHELHVRRAALLRYKKQHMGKGSTFSSLGELHDIEPLSLQQEIEHPLFSAPASGRGQGGETFVMDKDDDADDADRAAAA